MAATEQELEKKHNYQHEEDTHSMLGSDTSYVARRSGKNKYAHVQSRLHQKPKNLAEKERNAKMKV